MPFQAYNTIVEKLTVAQNAKKGRSDLYIQYLYNRLKNLLGASNAGVELLEEKGGFCLVFKGTDSWLAQMRQLANDYIADILVVGYKYEFFKERLALPLLSSEEKFLLYSALVSADYKEDKRYASRRLGAFEDCSIDGVYNFRLAELKGRWQEVLEYIPADFGKYELEGFVDYIVSENDGKAYLKEGKVYDENYREQQKSELLGKRSLIAEVLLSGAGSVYCFGKVDEETGAFLRKYYKEKAVFC